MKRLNRISPQFLLILAFAGAAGLTLVLASKLTFYADTWELLIERRDPSVDTLLHPHNEHLVLIPVLIEQLLLRLFGMTSALPEYVVLIAFLLTTAGLLYVYVERRVGPWLALFAAVSLLFLGPAWEVLLWPFEITFVGPILCGLAMLLALERDDGRGDVAACVLLVLSLCFSSLGVPFIAAAAVAVAQGPRATWLRRAYIFAIPLGLYALWWLGYGHDAESHLSLHNLLVSPVFVLDSIAVALASMLGLGTQIGAAPDASWGRALLVGLVVALGVRQWRVRGALYPALWPVLAAALANWFLTAFNAFPGRDPTSSRYQYAGAVFILLILSNLLKGVRPSRNVLITGAVVTACAVGSNLVILKDGRDLLDPQSVLTRADTAALEIARRTVPEAFQLSPEVAGTPSLVNVYAGAYLEAVNEYGSPAYTRRELLDAPEPAGKQADVILSQALPLSTVTRLDSYGPSSRAAGCIDLAGGSDSTEVRLAPGLNTIELAPGPHAGFSLRRFATDEYPVETEGADGDSVTLLRIPRDASRQPWYLHIDASQPAYVCSSDR